jgi:hypothetical protein
MESVESEFYISVNSVAYRLSGYLFLLASVKR